MWDSARRDQNKDSIITLNIMELIVAILRMMTLSIKTLNIMT